MNVSETFSRCKRSLASAALALSLVSGSASADIDPGHFFFYAIDPDRDGSTVSYGLDLGVDAFAGLPAFGTAVTDAGLQAWLNDPNASSLISWGVFAVGNDSSAEAFKVFSTVNPGDDPSAGLSQGDIAGAIGRGEAFRGEFNSVDTNGAAEGTQGAVGFPNTLGTNWGGITGFSTTGGVDENLSMWIFGIQNVNPFAGLPGDEIEEGFWTLDAATGSVGFAPIPVPAAVWMFGSALVGLFGIRRRQTA